jgi:hypothetical protein
LRFHSATQAVERRLRAPVGMVPGFPRANRSMTARASRVPVRSSAATAVALQPTSANTPPKSAFHLSPTCHTSGKTSKHRPDASSVTERRGGGSEHAPRISAIARRTWMADTNAKDCLTDQILSFWRMQIPILINGFWFWDKVS